MSKELLKSVVSMKKPCSKAELRGQGSLQPEKRWSGIVPLVLGLAIGSMVYADNQALAQAAPDIGTTNTFGGVVLWVSNDVSEVDDLAGISPLVVGAKKIAKDNSSITLEGFVIDQTINGRKGYFDDMNAIVKRIAKQYKVDFYGRGDIVPSASSIDKFETAFKASMSKAFNDDKQLIVISGGSIARTGNLLEDFIDSGNNRKQKSIWALEGGFAQITHGSAVGQSGNSNDKDLAFDRLRNPMTNSGKRPTNVTKQVNDAFADAYDTALENAGGQRNNFVKNTFLMFAENQNNVDAVRSYSNSGGDAILETIGDKTVRKYVEDNRKNPGSGQTDRGCCAVDISDVGLLAFLIGNGARIMTADDMKELMK